MPPRKKIPATVDAKLRAALRVRLATISLREASDEIGHDADGRPIPFGTLGDYARGHPAGRPHSRSHLTVIQAETLARYLGLRLTLDRAGGSRHAARTSPQPVGKFLAITC